MFQHNVWVGRLAIIAWFAAVVAACSDDTGTGASGGQAGNPNTGGQPPQGGQGGMGGGSTSTNTGGTANTGGLGGGGEGGMGGMGGGPNANPGPPGNSFVSAGGTVKSPNFTLVYSMGESTINANKMSSPSYRLQGGLVGATGTLP